MFSYVKQGFIEGHPVSTFLRIHKGDPPVGIEGTGKVRGSQRKHSLSQQCFTKVLHVTLTLLIPSAFINHWSGLAFFGGWKRGTKAQKDIVICIKTEIQLVANQRENLVFLFQTCLFYTVLQIDTIVMISKFS